MVSKICKPEYLEKARLLGEEEAERLLSRMVGKLPRRLEKDKLSRDEALAIQMEFEDEQLQEWRERMHALKGADAGKAAQKSKSPTTKKNREVAKVVPPATPAEEPKKAKAAAPAAPTKAALKAKPRVKKTAA